MNRVPALLLVPALIATFGVAPWLHTHVYEDHEHGEHHHGLSAHEHFAAASHPEDEAAHLDGCNPGTHAVPYAFVGAALPQAPSADAELALPGTPTPEIRIDPGVQPTDVRVHGPPARARSKPRAPPLIIHA